MAPLRLSLRQRSLATSSLDEMVAPAPLQPAAAATLQAGRDAGDGASRPTAPPGTPPLADSSEGRSDKHPPAETDEQPSTEPVAEAPAAAQPIPPEEEPQPAAATPPEGPAVAAAPDGAQVAVQRSRSEPNPSAAVKLQVPSCGAHDSSQTMSEARGSTAARPAMLRAVSADADLKLDRGPALPRLATRPQRRFRTGSAPDTVPEDEVC